MERLWTPWRMQYVGGEVREPGCIFCLRPAGDDDVASLILHRGTTAFVIMNLYPYNTGHVMVVPYQHAATLADLPPETVTEIFGLLPWVTAAQQRTLRCEGFNIGLNIGSVAGAGVADHLHVHVVPRWEGDANFMPIIANTMVLPELIPVTYAKLRAELVVSGLGREPGDRALPQAGAVVLVPAERKVALRRARDGSLVLPKGQIEPGEAAWQTALREVGEEMGLRAQVADWAGASRFTVDGEEKLVAYLTVTAEPGPDWEAHLGVDTLLLDPEEAVAALTHDGARDILRSALDRAGSLLGAGA
ncbi:HIT domain-containing protein [Sphaerobacter sp.]|uniref:HIT domain-containing protein n=1 Tax=Sphaerobacter sp. TaxID=2099654 RepID=UPI001DE5F4D4|nr:HIT domain-containing protein [Sphaerobacter sp.]MBX5445145.1 NUDIX domain-containing protein [Sphaerobacter sp.]